VFANVFGTTTLMVRMAEFLAIGGFHNTTTDFALLEWEFHVRAAVHKLPTEKVPEPTYFRRIQTRHMTDMLQSDASLLGGMQRHASTMSLLRYNQSMVALQPLMNAMPDHLASVVDLACALYHAHMTKPNARPPPDDGRWWEH
jgi:hypothetical protein